MKQSRLMRERIRRVTLLFKELGYQIEDEDQENDTYAAGFSGSNTSGGIIYIDRECRFLEIGYSFAFGEPLTRFIQAQIISIQDICYEFGCYFVVRNEDGEILLTIHSKLYYAGMNYFSLKETLRDLSSAVLAIEEQLAVLFDPDLEEDEYERS